MRKVTLQKVEWVIPILQMIDRLEEKLVEEKIITPFQLEMAKASSEQIKEIIKNLGTETLADDGLEKVIQGVTSIEEVLRVTAV